MNDNPLKITRDTVKNTVKNISHKLTQNLNTIKSQYLRAELSL